MVDQGVAPAPDAVPMEERSWEDLLAVIRAAEDAAASAYQLIRDSAAAHKVETAPWRERLAALEGQAIQARGLLRERAVANYRAHRNDISKRWGGVTVQFRPRVFILDPQAAAMALDGLQLIDEETGEAIPLVTYQPVFNERAIRAFISASAAAHRDQPNFPHLTPAGEGWPGVVVLQSEDDPSAWVLQVQKGLGA